MLFDSIKRNVFVIILYSIVIVLLLWAGNLLLGNKEVVLFVPAHPMPLHQLVIHWFYNNFQLAFSIGAGMVVLIAIMLYRLNEDHLFINRREPLLAILSVLLLSAFGSNHHILSVHFALFFMILSLNAAFNAYRREYAFREVFMGALHISVATLFYLPIIYTLLAFFICLGLMKPLRWRDWLVAVAGLAVPYIFALFYYHFADGNWQIPFLLFAQNIPLTIPTSIPAFSVNEWVYLIYTTLLVVGVILRLLFNPPVGEKIKTIRITTVFIWLFIIGIFCALFYPMQSSNEGLLIVVIPMVVLITKFFELLKNNALANTLFVLLLLSIVLLQLPDDIFSTIGGLFTNAWEFISNLF